MRKLILFCFLLAVVSVPAQKAWKKYLFVCSGAFVCGLADGTIESINYHYEDGFKLRCPKANDLFWNPAVSWKNKYRDGDPAKGEKFFGSTTALVFTTDAYHALRTTNRTITGGTIAWYMNDIYCNKEKTKKQRWKGALKDFLIISAVRSAGFHLTYSMLFRKQVP